MINFIYLNYLPSNRILVHLTVQPAANPGATFLVTIENGKFHGVIAATTPTACLRAITVTDFLGACSTSPSTRTASPANQRRDATLRIQKWYLMTQCIKWFVVQMFF